MDSRLNVKYAGPASDENYVAIHLLAMTGEFDHWFKAHPTMQREAMTTALTAIATDKLVLAYVVGTEIYSTVERI